MTTLKLKLGAPTPVKLKLNPGIVGPVGPQGSQGIPGIPGGNVSDADYGDVIVTGSGTIWTIDNDVVTYNKIQNISATARFLGRITAGAGNTEELTGTQATTLLNVFTDTLKGLAPLSGGGSTNFLRADGVWASPPGGAGVSDGDKGDIVVSGSGSIWTIDSGVVTLAKMANINTDRLIGRDTAASGIPEEISVGGGIEFTGSLGIQTSAFTGDVTKTAGSTALTIANDAVTYAKIQNISATARFIGRITAGAGDAEELTGTQATTLLDNFTSALKGLAPASGGGTTNFLRADGTWTAPSAVVADGDKGDITVSASGATWTIDADAVTYAKMQNVSATARVLGRKTAAAGDTEECTLSEVLDFVGSAAQGDILYRGASSWNRLAAGTSGNFLKTQGAGANPIWAASGTGTPSPSQGRLTLTSGIPVLISTVSAATTIYYTPYIGQYVPLYDGSSFTMTSTGGELSQATTDSTKSPTSVTTNSNYDLFVWNDGGTIRCTRGPAWSSDTSRGTGAGTTELTRVNGILLNANNITNGPSAQRGTYVGTVRSNGSSQIDWIYGGIAAGGTAAVLGVWNMHNRVSVSTFVGDNTNSWTYGSTTPQASNASTARRISFISGLQEDAFDFATYGFAQGSGTNAAVFGLGVDVTNAFSGIISESVAAATPVPVVASYGASFLGFHFIQDCEAMSGATTGTFYGDANAPTILQTGMFGKLRM